MSENSVPRVECDPYDLTPFLAKTPVNDDTREFLTVMQQSADEARRRDKEITERLLSAGADLVVGWTGWFKPDADLSGGELIFPGCGDYMGGNTDPREGALIAVVPVPRSDPAIFFRAESVKWNRFDVAGKMRHIRLVREITAEGEVAG